MASFNGTFDVELLILSPSTTDTALAVEPIVFTEDFAATTPSVTRGRAGWLWLSRSWNLRPAGRPGRPVTGEAADLLTLIRTLDLDDYVTLIEHLAPRTGRPGIVRPALTVQHLHDILRADTSVVPRPGRAPVPTAWIDAPP